MRIDLCAPTHCAPHPRGAVSLPRFLSVLIVAGLVVAGVIGTPLFASTQQTDAQPPATPTMPHKPVSSHKHAAKKVQPAPVPLVAAVPPAAPKAPDWPANAQPVPATVLWNSQGLRIEASNSSLSQILKDVATATGAKVAGLGADQRIFGTYGPGDARDVLAKLLEGSGYNLLLIGDKGQGTPREIVLSAQAQGGAPPAANNPAPANDENNEVEDQPQEQPQPQPQPPVRNGFAPGAPPRTPQQIMQEMQQRQLQMQEQQAPNNPQ